MAVSELVGAILTRPSTGIEQAAALLRRHWAIDGELRSMPSERDRNFAVAVDGVDRFVLKISNAGEDPGFLELQHLVMRRLAAGGVPSPLPVAGRDGRETVDAGSPDAPQLVRLLTWLPGRPLATIPIADRPEALLADLGRTMARTVVALDGLDHPAAHRPFQWSAEDGSAVVATHAGAVTDRKRAALLGRWQRRLARLVAILPDLRHGLIHNDANDHNVLVADDGASISGVLDLGDSTWSVTVNELAVAAAYAALDTPDPLATIETVRLGFEAVLRLEDRERAILLELIALRLATSVALSAHQARLDPDDAYLTVSEAPAWALLERLIAIEPEP